MSRIFKNAMIFVLAFAWILNLSSCLPQDSLENIVVTEDLLYISGERVRITGRVIEVNGNVDDHGFYISKSPDFSSPIVISLGPKTNGLGRFIGEYDLLEVNTQYYFRSYANIGGTEVTGQTVEFSSLEPGLKFFTPSVGVEGDLLTIEGLNFTHDTRVLIDGNEVAIISLKDESLIVVRVPPMPSVAEAIVSVSVQDTLLIFAEPFKYHFGHWELEGIFPDNTQLYESMFFRDNDQFIFGMGTDSRFSLNLNVWSLDLITKIWSELNFPGNSGSRSPFTSAGYWGTGATVVRTGAGGLNVHTSDFWQYQAGNFELKPFLPFRLYESIGMHLNGELYVFGGILFDHSQNSNIYKFDELVNEWTSIDVTALDLSSAYPYFEHNNEAYFVQPDNIIWKYSPLSGTWTEVGYYPVEVKEDGVAVNVNGKVYIGLFNDDVRLFEWDMASDIWIEKLSIPGSPKNVNNGFFTYNNKPYFFRSKYSGGQFESDPHMELWSLDPNRIN